MANDTNIVLLVGRLTRDAEIRYTSSGTAVCRFSLAVNRISGSGEKKAESVGFFDVAVWSRLAETIHPYLAKGKQVCVSGELRQNRWEQDGETRSKIEVSASTVQLLGGDRMRDSSAEATGDTYGRTYSKSEQISQPQKKEPVQNGFHGNGFERVPVSGGSGFDPPKGPPGSTAWPGPETFKDDIPF